MLNRIRGVAEEPFDDGDVPYGDFVVVSGAFGCAYVTHDTARTIERALDRARPPKWVAFADRVGSRFRVRTREIRVLCESTAEQRAADRRYDRARRLEERADRRSWEEEF
jgi:hypothetical protein